MQRNIARALFGAAMLVTGVDHAAATGTTKELTHTGTLYSCFVAARQEAADSQKTVIARCYHSSGASEGIFLVMPDRGILDITPAKLALES